MYTINLPFGGGLYVCSTCGFVSRDEKRVEKCKAVGIQETTQLKVGEVVSIYQKERKDDGSSNVSKSREQWTVSSIYYSQPGSRGINGAVPYEIMPPHTLCVDLVQQVMGGTASTIFTHQDLKLWEKGDIGELKMEGLIKEAPRPQPFSKKLRSFLH